MQVQYGINKINLLLKYITKEINFQVHVSFHKKSKHFDCLIEKKKSCLYHNQLDNIKELNLNNGQWNEKNFKEFCFHLDL